MPSTLLDTALVFFGSLLNVDCYEICLMAAASPPNATIPYREKLRAESGVVLWSDLYAHAHRQALFLLKPPLDLLDAALAVALNDAESVQGWLETGALYRPTEPQLEAWTSQLQKPFRSVVVQPFVLAVELTENPPKAP